MPKSKSSRRSSGSRSSTRRHPPRRRSFTGVWNYLLVLGILMVVALGGGTTLWAKALLLVVVGLWVLIRPPEQTPTRRFDWVILLFMLWSLTAYLPFGLLGGASWHSDLKEAGLDLSWTATPQPWLSAEVLVLMLGGVLWFYQIWNVKIGHDDRRSLLWVFVLGATLLAVGQILGTVYDWRSPFQASGLGFSYFPNKNQTGLFFAMSAACAFGLTLHLLRVKRRSSLIAGVCLLLCFLAILFSFSRAALVLFFFGCSGAYFTAFSLKGAFRALRFVLPILVIGMTVLMVMGRESLKRFSLWTSGGEGYISELRFDILRDVANMITSLPISGLTAGNFSGLFAQYHESVDTPMLVIHPESDWLWVLSEFGVPGFALLALVVAAAMTRFIPFTPLVSDHSKNYRAPAFGAIIIFLLHSLVDVPGHRLGTILCLFFLYRLAVGAVAKEDFTVLPPWVYRILGIVILPVGILWFFASIFDKPWTTNLAQEHAEAVLTKPFSAGSKERMNEAIEQAIAAKPLYWWNYNTRARYELTYERDAKAADKNFMIARQLEPNIAEVPFQEGVVWMNHSPRQAAQAWKEALGRKIYVPDVLYREILDVGSRKPQFARQLANLSIQDPELRYRYLMVRRGNPLDEALYFEQGNDPQFKTFSPLQRKELLKHWARSGDGSALRAHLRTFPELTDYPWYYSAYSLASDKQYEEAINALDGYMTIPRFPEFTQFDMAMDNELRQSFITNSNDIVRGSVLLERQIQAQNWQGARQTAKLLMDNEEIPDYAYYWDGELSRRAGLYKEAWDSWQPYLDNLVERKSTDKALIVDDA